MPHRRRGLLAVLVTVVSTMLAPAAAQAWTITTYIHGAGAVGEVTNRNGDTRNQGTCTVQPGGKNEGSVTACPLGSASGNWASFDIVRLQNSVPAAAFNRGWRFQKWVEGSTKIDNVQQIDCDPSGIAPGGNHFGSFCEFQIFENLRVELYFDDTFANPVDSLNGPSGTTAATSATFTFGASGDPDSTYQCRLQRPNGLIDWFGCTSGHTFNGLTTSGQHTFSVRSVDPSGNVGGSLSRTWTIDNTAPQTTISSTPGAASGASATFAFTADEAATFQCRLDTGALSTCTSPKTYDDLSEGSHTFTVVATDPYGHTDPTAASHTWTVDRTPPETTLLDGPAEGSTSPSNAVTFAFASPESGVGFECRVDTDPFAPCTSPHTVQATNGDHLFEVRAKDAGGNVDQTPAKRSWRVNSLDDDADGINRPQDCNDANAAIHPGAVDVPDNGVDENCDGADSTDLDRDRDGASRPLDCNDGNAAIRPGAVDVPGDGIDQDCKDGDAAFPVVKASVRWVWAVLGGLTRATRFRVSDLAPGSVVKVSCKGRGCPFKSKQGKPSAKGVVDVKKLLKGRKLKAGNTFEVRISAPGTVTKVLSFRMRKGKLPTGGKVTCQAPGAAKPTAC